MSLAALATALPVATATETALPVAAFNQRVLDAAGASWPLSPLQVTIRFLGGPGLRPESRTMSIAMSFSTAEGGRPPGTLARVTVIHDGLPDDSVRAQRTRLVLLRRASGAWTLRSARRSVRCQPGRGHQGFSAEPCT
jgi:hypothetical protein